MKKLLLIASLFLSVNIFAWNGDGHRVVAQIAYDNLTAAAKKKINKLTYPEGEKYSAQSRFLYTASWADIIRYKGDHRFDSWHYIDLPISVGGAPTIPSKAKNVVWAVGKSVRVLKSKYSSEEKKRMYLKLLVHFVGDAHQPLHAVNRFTWKNRQGDKGGNIYYVINPHRKKVSLHSFWDSGLGIFRYYDKRFPRRNLKIKKIARKIERKYPHNKFGIIQIYRPPMAWVEEGRYLAKTFVYNVQENGAPNGYYVSHGQQIVEQRLALAGYRLAHILNDIYQ